MNMLFMDLVERYHKIKARKTFSKSLDQSFSSFPFWNAVWSYQPQMEERDPIWGDDWSHSLFINGFLTEVFPSHKADARRSVHSPWDHFIITLIISDWCDTWGKWPLARKLDSSWWHRHTSLKFFWLLPHGSMDNRVTILYSCLKNVREIVLRNIQHTALRNLIQRLHYTIHVITLNYY